MIDFSKPVEIQLYNSSLTQLRRFKGYIYWNYTRKYRENDSFEFHINKNIVGATDIQINSILAYYDGQNTRAGFVENIEVTLPEEGVGSEILVCKGRSLEGKFYGRLCLANISTGTGYDIQTGVDAETAMRYYVNVNCIDALDQSGNSDTSRNFPNFILQTNQNRGVNIEYSARLETLYEAVSTIANFSGLGFGSVFNPGNNFEFEVLEGTDHSECTSNPVVFSPKFYNLSTLSWLENILDSVNLAYVGGDGVDASRMIVQTYIETSEPEGFNRREFFVDERDISGNDELILKGQAAIETAGDQYSISFELLNQTFIYMSDFDLGDIVTIRYPGIVTIDTRIIEIMDEVDENGRRITIIAGTNPQTDITRMVRESLKQTKGERQ